MDFFKGSLILLAYTAIIAHGEINFSYLWKKLITQCKRKTPMPMSEMEPTFAINTTDRDFPLITVRSEADIKSAVHNLNTDIFQNKNRVVFIVHGFQGGDDDKWPDYLAHAILDKDNQTVVIPSYWEKGSGANIPWYKMFMLPHKYRHAVANTGTIAESIAMMAREIRNSTVFQGAKKPFLYCIGFSLGAHVCGQAGRIAKTYGFNFNRISGLDPAGPDFKDCPKEYSLGNDSADCVDVIHTDHRKFGHPDPLGHIDFYPNEGKHQPECTGIPSCSHLRSVQLFYTTIVNKGACKVRGKCKDSSGFQFWGITIPDLSCLDGGWQSMGYHSHCYYKSLTSHPTGGRRTDLGSHHHGNFELPTDGESLKCQASNIPMDK